MNLIRKYTSSLSSDNHLFIWDITHSMDNLPTSLINSNELELKLFIINSEEFKLIYI